MPVAVDTRTRAVESMRLGDHAFAHYADDGVRWETLAAFTQLGLAHGDRVVVLADPAVPDTQVLERLAAWSPAAEEAEFRGQLQITSMHALIRPHRRFTAQHQIDRLWEETERARHEGYTGLRSFVDMAWVQDWGMDIEAVMYRETHADALFADRSYAEVCAYDRRRFEPDVLEAMRVGHPVALLERPGDLAAHHSINGLHLIGDADAATAAQFQAAVHDALAAAATADRLLLDLTRLCFLSMTCARALISLVADAQECRRVDVRCSPFHARLLRRTGAEALGNLALPPPGGNTR
ncbi:MEDS domain-containing protein [Streptomyces minutiscleroticus]|uniref:MEDS domain-containing protein n=1 Tax=Streptomyces minutiscleroticus TaxID=68238 RepID=UPI003321B12D